MSYKAIKEAYHQMLIESTEHPMIEVDGVMKHRHNSLGQPIHHTDEGIKNFHRWFGDSKAVDEHGRPHVLYHGTNQDFDSFDFDKARENEKVWLSNNPRVASNFALYRTVWNNANVLPVYVKTNTINHIDGEYKNIRDVDSDIDATKHHVTIFHNVRDPVSPSIDPISDVWAVSKQAEIKSAIGNSGAFSHPTKITESVYDSIAKSYVRMLYEESPYSEGQSSTATHNKKEYRLDTLFKLTHNRSPENVEVSKLSWILPYTTTDKHRVDVADTTKPVLVYNDKQYGLSVIDGAHRLKKAHDMKMTHLPAVMLSDDDMKSAEI